MGQIAEDDIDFEIDVATRIEAALKEATGLMPIRAGLAPGNNPASLSVDFGEVKVTITKAALIENIRQGLRLDVTNRIRTALGTVKELRGS